jgi:hypothetical protein
MNTNHKMLFCLTSCTKRSWKSPSSSGLIKFSRNVAISGDPSVTNHCSPLVMFKCSRSDGYGFLTLALGLSHDLPFHFSTSRGLSVEDQSSTATRHAPILQVFSRTHRYSKSTGIVDILGSMVANSEEI